MSFVAIAHGLLHAADAIVKAEAEEICKKLLANLVIEEYKII